MAFCAEDDDEVKMTGEDDEVMSLVRFASSYRQHIDHHPALKFASSQCELRPERDLTPKR